MSSQPRPRAARPRAGDLELTGRMRAVLGERLLVDPVAQQALAGLIEGAGRTEEKFHLQITGARLVPDAGGTAIAPPASAVAQNGHGHGNDTGEPA